MDIARTEGQIAGEKAKSDPQALAAARAELAGKGKLNPTADEIAKQAYDTAMKPFGTGSALQQGLQAATAAIQGLAGGSVAQAVSGAAAPYLAEQIHRLTTDANGKVNTEANLMAHAVVGAVTAYAAGNSALAGASGAAMSEFIAQQLYPDIKREDLSEEQRQTISALGTLAAGLAGGVVGDSTADAVAGAQAGKTALENNTLAVPVTPPPVAGTNTGEAVSDANNTMASALDKAVKNIVESIDKATECSFGRACTSDESGQENAPNVAKDLTDAEKAELGGSGSGTPGGWEPQDEENARNSETVKQQQQNHFDELSKLYDKSNASQNLNIDGQTIRQGEVSNNYGTTKVFESQNLTDQQIHKYAQQLAGETPLKEVRPGIYTAKLDNGTSITLRNVSSSQNQTGARWTIDIKGNKQLTDIGYKFKDVEMKFK